MAPNTIPVPLVEQNPGVAAPQADSALIPDAPTVPQVPPLVQSMGQATQVANKINASKPGGAGAGDWARAINAGVQTALAGAGNIGTVPKGAGALYGVEKTMQGYAEEQRKNVAQRMQQEQQQQESQFKKQELGMDQQKLQDQEKYDSFQTAQAQAKNVRDIVLFNRQMKQADTEDQETQLKMQGEELRPDRPRAPAAQGLDSRAESRLHHKQVTGEGGSQGGPAQAGGAVKMKAPDGSIKIVPQAQVGAAQAAGGVVVQ